MRKHPMNAYEQASLDGMSAREAEASILTKAAIMLKDCRDDWAHPDRKERLAAALKFNLKVWSFFQVELAKPDNPLPQSLKLNILRLSAFVDRRSFDIMGNPVPEKLDIIIDINFNLAAGLRQKSPE